MRHELNCYVSFTRNAIFTELNRLGVNPREWTDAVFLLDGWFMQFVERTVDCFGKPKESCADVLCHHTHDSVILTGTNGRV